MNKICTDLEQSKKLIELGIDIYTADMFWKNGVSDKYIQCFNPFVGSGTNMDYDYDVPAWSLAALLGVIKPINENTYTIRGTLDGGAIISFDEITNIMFQEEEIIDAVFEMVCWLKENKKI